MTFAFAVMPLCVSCRTFLLWVLFSAAASAILGVMGVRLVFSLTAFRYLRCECMASTSVFPLPLPLNVSCCFSHWRIAFLAEAFFVEEALNAESIYNFSERADHEY